MEIERTEIIIQNCIKHIESVGYKSFDLFDGLTNPVLNTLTAPFPYLRRVVNQVNSRSPLDLHWLGMKKMVHTKLIADLVWLFSLTDSKEKAIDAYKALLKLKIKDGGLLWGLNFPYTSRFVNADPDTPNLYNTATSGLAICELCKLDKENQDEYKTQIGEIITSIFQVFRFYDEKSSGWVSYYPGQTYPTYNVNALLIYFLCKANYSLNSEVVSPEIVKKIIELLIKEQNQDGSWYYSRSEKGRWIDGFHSGFIIESLAYVYSHGFADPELLNALKKSWDFYIENLFTEEGFPKYYSDGKMYPIEAQNSAQAIQTLSVVGLWMNWHQDNLLEKVIMNTVSNLYDPVGYFYHKRSRHFTYRSSYFRWSTSPALIALAYSEIYFKNRLKNII
jgi:hypothetical protein